MRYGTMPEGARAEFVGGPLDGITIPWTWPAGFVSPLYCTPGHPGPADYQAEHAPPSDPDAPFHTYALTGYGDGKATYTLEV